MIITLWHISTICSSFSSSLFSCNFRSLLTVFGWFCTWNALANVDLHFSKFYSLLTVHPCIMFFKMKPTRSTLLLSTFISTSLHVSGNYVPIIRRNYFIYVTLVFFTLYGWSTLADTNRTSMTNTCCVYTVLRYSWWWTSDLSEIFRVIYQINLRNSSSRWNTSRSSECQTGVYPLYKRAVKLYMYLGQRPLASVQCWGARCAKLYPHVHKNLHRVVLW